ncbi:cytosine deaminase [Tistlia consotensis]|uniref:Cytosine deaminase n=1 Tax=Tistlia consotensis USBA 355 TaxID=560819 RepID=A0A1Y6BUB5_9PROT|nr:nucleoside deaminase [Tistlia consotensis]SMF18848.1 cytosine deaminase [Tistlia consotensis USBA 355]SNR39379.1 cytosine deaminase [Tistlia consotensis]
MDDERRTVEGSTVTEADRRFMAEAFEEARKGLAEGGIPIGAVLVRDGAVVARGHNRRVQLGDLTAHGEVDCLRAAGPVSVRGATLYTTLSPCWMCSGTVLQFGIGRVVIGDNVNFKGRLPSGLEAEAELAASGVAVAVINDPDWIALFRDWTAAHPELWGADIGS